MALRWQAGLLACMCLLLGSSALARAQEASVNPQGIIMYNVGKWLTSNDVDVLKELGWTYGGNPCNGWTGVECNTEGYVSTINLANKGLTGSLPAETSLWGGLTGLTTLDLAGNALGGPVPSQLTAAGPQLASINLSGNTAICGTAPAGLTGVDSTGTNLGTDCSAVTDATPPANTTTDGTTAGNATAGTPPAANATDGAPAPATANTTAATPAPAPAPAAAPAPPPTVIANAPICSCALKGFGSDDCATALKNTCAGSNPPDVCKAGDPSGSESAAEQLGQYLAQACFPGQNMDTSICNCAQNLLGNDCAKARVNLCVAKDPSCLAFQNIIDVNGSTSAAAVGQVAPMLEQKCPISEPSVPGVKATMEFPDLSMGQYITRQYTQNVANALSSVTNVPSTSISALDVRPFTGSGGSGRRRRALLQSSGNGVQATYFLATQDPSGVSTSLSQAANDGTLSTRLGQYGIQAQAGGLKVQSFLPAPQGSGSSSGGFPLWAIGPIVGGVVLLALLAGLICCCRRKRAAKKATEYAPDAKAVSASGSDLPKSTYDYTPSSPGVYTPVTASAAGVGAAAATAAAAANRSPSKGDDLPVSRSIKVVGGPESVTGSAITRWESGSSMGGGGGSSFSRAAAPAAAAAPGSGLTPVRTSSGNVAGSVEMAGGAAAAAAAGSGRVGEPSSAAAGWRSNVRPASGQLPASAGATSSMAATAGKSGQQAERAKFWAQFQETWQQVRQTQNINDGEPGTPSSGTNWTDVTGTDSRR